MTTDNEISELMDKIYFILKEQNFDELDEFIASVDINFSPEILVGVLRISYAVYRGDKLSNWEIFRDKVKIELDRRNLNTKEILTGLM